MGTPNIQLRVTEEANESLKRVIARFPKWSLAQLADTLITESCAAVLSTKATRLGTVDYLRQQLGLDPPVYEQMESIAARIEEAAAAFGEAVAESKSAKKQAARTKRAA